MKSVLADGGETIKIRGMGRDGSGGFLMAEAEVAADSMMRIDIWSDVVCPWCAIGKAHLEEALGSFDHSDDVVIRWRSFELDPSAPAVRTGNYAGMIAKKYGMDEEQAQAMVDQMTARGEAVGVDFRFDRVQPGNTFDAHRVIHLGGLRGMQTEVKSRMLKGYLADGEAIGLPEVVHKLGVEAGLDPDEVTAVLETEAFADEVRADELLASQLQVTGVPFFVFDGRFAVAGAQPPEVLLEVLQRAWSDREPQLEIVAEGDACGPEGCEI